MGNIDGLPVAQEHWGLLIESVELMPDSPDTMIIRTKGGWQFACNVNALTMPVHAQMSHADDDVVLFELEEVHYVAEVEGYARKYQDRHNVSIPAFAYHKVMEHDDNNREFKRGSYAETEKESNK
jgi:hypothetical protein